MTKSKDQAKEPPKFEEAIEQLESIIEKIESGEVGLEESLSQYESGMKLIMQCRKILDAAEQRIDRLALDAKGKLKIESGEAGPGDSGLNRD